MLFAYIINNTNGEIRDKTIIATVTRTNCKSLLNFNALGPLLSAYLYMSEEINEDYSHYEWQSAKVDDER